MSEDIKRTAKFVKKIGKIASYANLYKVSPPFLYGGRDDSGEWQEKGFSTEYIVVSACVDMEYHETTTHIYVACLHGDRINWHPQTGSYMGGMSHEKALKDAGYTLIEHAPAQLFDDALERILHANARMYKKRIKRKRKKWLSEWQKTIEKEKESVP